jgi:hypothetical protein
MTLCGDNWLYEEASLKKSWSSLLNSARKQCQCLLIVSDHRLKTERVQCKFLCLYVVVNIANEEKKLQTPADIIPLYARKI